MAQILLRAELEEKFEAGMNANELLRQQVATLMATIANNSSASSSAFVQTTEALPRLTSGGPQSIYHIRNIEIVEQYVDRVLNGTLMSIELIAEPQVITAMNSVMRTRSDFVFEKVGELPQGPNNTRVWLTWPIKMALQAWGPCIEKNSSATQALKLKELLVDVKVACPSIWPVSGSGKYGF